MSRFERPRRRPSSTSRNGPWGRRQPDRGGGDATNSARVAERAQQVAAPACGAGRPVPAISDRPGRTDGRNQTGLSDPKTNGPSHPKRRPSPLTSCRCGAGLRRPRQNEIVFVTNHSWFGFTRTEAQVRPSGWIEIGISPSFANALRTLSCNFQVRRSFSLRS